MWLFVTVPGSDGRKPKLARVYPVGGEADDAILRRFGGTVTRDMGRFFRDGTLVSYNRMRMPTAELERERDAFAEAYDFGPNSWPHWLKYIVPTGKGRGWWNREGKALLDAAAAAREAETRAVSRYVLLGGPSRIRGAVPREVAETFPARFPPPSPTLTMDRRPAAFARVVRETANRFYLDDVVRLPGGGTSPVEGSTPNLYCPRAAVIAENVTLEAAMAAAAAAEEIQQDLDRIAATVADEVLPAYLRMADRIEQKKAEYEDLLRDRLADVRPKP